MKREYVITTMLLAVLVACSAPVIMGQCPCPPGDPVDDCKPGVATGPCPCYCGTSGTVVSGTVHVEYEQDPDETSSGSKVYSMDFDVPAGDIKWARVYWHVWGGTASHEGWTNAMFCNPTDCFECNQYIPPVSGAGSPSNCNQTECCGYYMGGFGTHWVYWNVTDCITTGSNSLSVDNSDWEYGDVMHMKLVAVIENMEDFPSDLFPTTNYWINQGYRTLSSANPTYTTWFNGNINQRDCTLWHYALANHEMDISFNNNNVASYPWNGDWYDECVELIPAGMVEGDGSQSMKWDAGGDDPHVVEAILVDNDYYLKPDLVVEDKKIEHLNYTGRYLLHLSTALDLTNPVSSDWWECWPIYDRWWDLDSWTDTQPDGKLGKDDIISMTNMTDVAWYHVDGLAFRLSVRSETTFVDRYLDSGFDYYSGGLTDPTGDWRETFPDYAQRWVITDHEDNNGNYIVDHGDQVYMVNLDDGGLTEWYRVRNGGWPIAPAVTIAMSVSELCAPCYNYSCYCQTPTEFVAEHTYDVDVLIKNDGGGDSGAFIVSLYDNLVTVDTKRVDGLGSDPDNNAKWVRFQWHPATHGSHQLKVMVDSDHEVEELSETNNNLTQNEVVLQPGDPDLDAYPCCIDFSPAWMSNATDITVTVLNDGTGDACCFTVGVTMTSDCSGDPGYPWTDCVTTSVCAKAHKDITFTSPELTRGCDYTVTVTLDTANDVGESNEGNNDETKVFHAVHVKLKVTHHYGNMSTYNGVLSDNNPVAMFELHKNVADCTTPYKLLTSEADVLLLEDNFNLNGINRSCAAMPGTSTWYLNRSASAEECPPGRPIYWYLSVNGIPTPDMPTRMYDYTFNDCEVMHIDLLKYVNSGNSTAIFRPRPIMDFPEPFKHGGYDGLVADTTIVHPSNDPGGDYATIAGDIKDNLVNNCGILSGRIHIHTDATVGGNKNTDHLILIGTPQENSLIATANAGHAEIGMPMYFMDRPNNVVWLIDDWLYNDDDPDIPDCCSLADSSYHSVVMACDNPFPNALPWTDTWKDDDLTMWIASGVTDCYAKDAANMLTLGCGQPFWDDKGFWNRTRMCGDVNGDCIVSVGDVYPCYIKNIATSEWAADVNGDHTVSVGDVYPLYTKNLNCCY